MSQQFATFARVFRAYMPAVLPHWKWFLLLNLVMTGSVATKYAHPFMLRASMQWLDGDAELWTIVGSFGLVLLAHLTLWTFFDPLVAYFGLICMRDAERLTLEAMQKQSTRFFENNVTNSLVASAKRFRHTLEFVIDQWSLTIGRIMIMIVATTVVFYLERPWLGIVFGIWSIGYLGFNFRLALYRMSLGVQVGKADSASNAVLGDALANNATIRLFAREKDIERKFDVFSQARMDTQFRADLIGGLINRVQGIFVFGLELAVLWVLGTEWRKGTLPLSDFVFYQTYLMLAIHQLWEVAGSLNKTFQHLGDAAEVADIHLSEPEVTDAAGAVPLKVPNGRVVFHAVHFAYGDKGNGAALTINNVSLAVEPGEMIALVGESGGGKTTLAAKLLPRLYDLDSGFIEVDGQDITTVTLVSLRQQIVVVPQRPDLLCMSVLEIVRFANSDASEDDVIEALRNAEAWGFVSKLKDGIHTFVGDRGTKLSGGQIQRIAIARAFLADPKIVVLDEATSALDGIIESKIQKAIGRLLKGRTCIVIAHRLSTIRKANRIAVMKEGRIIEIGTHDALLARKGAYSELHGHQFGNYLAPETE